MDLLLIKTAAENVEVHVEKLNRNITAIEMGETPSQVLTDAEYIVAVTANRLSDPRFTGRTFQGIVDTDHAVDAITPATIALALFALIDSLKVGAWAGRRGKMYYRYKNHQKAGVAMPAAYIGEEGGFGDSEEDDELDS